MRQFGKEKRECYVWWGGYFTSDGDAQVVTALCPNIPSKFGCIRLGIKELTLLHSRLRTLDQVLLVELHTHPPGAGGQNSVDAAHPAAPYRGFVSVVVPNFAFPQFYDLRKTHVYEYLDSGEWRQLEPREVQGRFVVEEGFMSVRV